ncbi:MAG: permease [Anaerotignum sp.]|nr:permease [Anaerotignum sp.]
MDTYIFYGIAIIFLMISFRKDRKKTMIALKKAWKSFENLLPQLFSVLLIVGLMLSVMNADVISKIIGADSGFLGVAIAATVGAITLIPPYVAFPTAAMLLQNGAGYMQIGTFVSALMMVGIATLPIEMKYFGKKLTILRNVLAFIFSFIVGLIIKLVVG